MGYVSVVELVATFYAIFCTLAGGEEEQQLTKNMGQILLSLPRLYMTTIS